MDNWDVKLSGFLHLQENFGLEKENAGDACELEELREDQSVPGAAAVLLGEQCLAEANCRLDFGELRTNTLNQDTYVIGILQGVDLPHLFLDEFLVFGRLQRILEAQCLDKERN